MTEIIGQRILIFGGTGSLGKKLVQRFKDLNEVAVYSRDEAKHWTMRNEMGNHRNLSFFVGDVRDFYRVKEVIKEFEPTILIIAAALKQVDTCEKYPLESVKTNVEGTQNVIDAVSSLDNTTVKKILFVSTDKACSPVNVYGMCKSISERIVTSRAGSSSVDFLATRYGNVLESRGSIIPLFKYQAEHCDELTVTDPGMTRFVMTLDDSVNLIANAISHGKTGDMWIPILPAMRIGDLAEIFASRHGKKIKIIGPRPGEKKHEDLVNLTESIRSYRFNVDGMNHHVIRHALSGYNNDVTFSYSSNDEVMSKEELEKHLTNLGILDLTLDDFTGKSIEEIVK